ncbi:potassium-transporting ATPase subunit KdpB [Alistipes sp.]|uniref:potassium-transporting ATPase subunit KdpB n=1 Tax=Alistipes sp. TaxID=1872444 RepID=UPI003AF15E84
MKRNRNNTLFDPTLLRQSLLASVLKLDPRTMIKNPIMFTVEAVTFAMLLLIGWIAVTGNTSQGSLGYNVVLFAVLLATVLFANFAEAIAEARGKAQADSLRKTREETPTKRIEADGQSHIVSSSDLRPGDLFECVAGDTVPADGEIVEGLASIDESAITGESAPVIREAGGDKSSVTGGTKVLSDRIRVRVTARPGESFLDRMIALVEGSTRQKTPNEIALTILLAGFTLVFVIVCATLKPFADYVGANITVAAFISLFVCLIPTTIGGLLSAIGIAGMDRALRANVITKSGRAVETAGDIDTLLLDKTGTITIGNRKATAFHPADGIDPNEFTRLCMLSSVADETPEGKSIVELCVEKGFKSPDPLQAVGLRMVKFSAETKCSGVDLPDGTRIRKGASEAIIHLADQAGNGCSQAVERTVRRISENGGTPLVVCRNERIAGVIELQDIIKTGIRERFERLRKMGVKTVMVTGDNPLTAKYIAEKAGVDDFIAEARPEDKLEYIRREQRAGKLVAMMGDGTNDAPALAQADVGVAMNSGTQAAKEAGNMVDLDNDPTKLIEIVEIGKQLLMTRGTLTTFSIANDVAKYFAIVPALFIASVPSLQALNIMHLYSPESAILSAVIFNAIIIPLLIPLALRGVKYKPIGASALLRRNLFIYGLGGVIVPFIGIKLIDMLVSVFF